MEALTAGNQPDAEIMIPGASSAVPYLGSKLGPWDEVLVGNKKGRLMQVCRARPFLLM